MTFAFNVRVLCFLFRAFSHSFCQLNDAFLFISFHHMQQTVSKSFLETSKTRQIHTVTVVFSCVAFNSLRQYSFFSAKQLLLTLYEHYQQRFEFCLVYNNRYIYYIASDEI